MRVFFKLILAILLVVSGFVFSLPPTEKEIHEQRVCGILKTHRTIKIFADQSIQPRERLMIESTLGRFNVFDGLTVVEVQNRANADITITNRSNLGNDGIIGIQPPYSNLIYLNVGNILTDLQFQAVFMHETAHWIGLRHICVANEREECSNVGKGIAIMNPITDTNPPVYFSGLDSLEFRRVVSFCR